MGIIKNYTAPSKAADNRYAKAVDAMIDAGGVGVAYEIVVPTDAVKGEHGTAATERALFQSAAREKGYSVKTGEKDVDKGAGTTRFVFVLIERRKREVKPKADAAE